MCVRQNRGCCRSCRENVVHLSFICRIKTLNEMKTYTAKEVAFMSGITLRKAQRIFVGNGLSKRNGKYAAYLLSYVCTQLAWQVVTEAIPERACRCLEGWQHNLSSYLAQIVWYASISCLLNQRSKARSSAYRYGYYR